MISVLALLKVAKSVAVYCCGGRSAATETAAELRPSGAENTCGGQREVRMRYCGRAVLAASNTLDMENKRVTHDVHN